MARIRSIKPEFWSNDRLSALPIEAHMLAGALLNYADDEGYFNANPGLIKAACFPIRETSMTVPGLIREVSEIDYIRIAEGTDGRTYGWIVKFNEHQRVDKPKPSKIKGLADFGDVPVKSGTDPGRIPDTSPGRLPLIVDASPLEGKGKGTGNGKDSPPAPQGGVMGRFDEWYALFPSNGRKNRDDATKAWKALKPNDDLQDRMIRALQDQITAYKLRDDWPKRGWKYFSGTGPWIRGREWATELIHPTADPGATTGRDYVALFIGLIGAEPEDQDPDAILDAADKARVQSPDNAAKINAWLIENGLMKGPDHDD